MKRKRKNDTYWRLRRLADLAALTSILAYTLFIIILGDGQMWIPARLFLALSVVSVLVMRRLKASARLMFLAIIIQCVALTLATAMQGIALVDILMVALTFTPPILALGRIQLRSGKRQPPADHLFSSGQDTTRLELHDKGEAPASSYDDETAERRVRRVQWLFFPLFSISYRRIYAGVKSLPAGT